MEKWLPYSNLHADIHALHRFEDYAGDVGQAVAKLNFSLATIRQWDRQLDAPYKYPVLEFAMDVCFYVRSNHDVRSLKESREEISPLLSAEATAAREMLYLWNDGPGNWHSSPVELLTKRVHEQWIKCDDRSRDDMLSLMSLLAPYFKSNRDEIIKTLDHASTSITSRRQQVFQNEPSPLSDQARELLLAWCDLARVNFDDLHLATEFYRRIDELLLHLKHLIKVPNDRDALDKFVIAIRGIEMPLDRGRRLSGGYAYHQAQLDRLGDELDRWGNECEADVKQIVRACKRELVPYINGRLARAQRYYPGTVRASVSLRGEPCVGVEVLDLDDKRHAGIALRSATPLDLTDLRQVDVSLTFSIPGNSERILSIRATIVRYWPSDRQWAATGMAVTLIQRRFETAPDATAEDESIADWLAYARAQVRIPNPSL